MRAKHTPHSLPAFPVYSSAFLSPNQLLVGGGGGSSKSGIKNKIRLYDVQDGTSTIELLDELQLEAGEDAPMSMATAEPTSTIVCGINSREDKILAGTNENCRVFGVVNRKLGLLSTKSTLPAGEANLDDYQRVTVLSPDATMVAVAGSNTLSLLSYPTLLPIAPPLVTSSEIYDASFTSDSLLVATTSDLFIYAIHSSSSSQSNSTTSSPKKKKKKGRGKRSGSQPIALTNGGPTAGPALTLVDTIGLPQALGGTKGSLFRSARFNPTDPGTIYTLTNTAPVRNPRSKSKTASRQGYVAKWTKSGKEGEWAVEKVRKVSEKGATVFQISPNGKLLGFGSSDFTIGLLDSQTLTPTLQILHAHSFPPTTLAFNPDSSLIVSGSADNTIRVIQVPQGTTGYSWGFILFLLTIIVLLLALAMQYMR